MNLSISLQAVKDLYSFPFRDPQWQKKLLIGAGVTLAGMFVPVVPWLAAAGYGARLMRDGASNADPAQLPEWDDWGDLLLDGVRLLGAGLLVSLPVMIIMGGGWLLYMVGVINMSLSGQNPSGGEAIFMLFSLAIMFFSMGLGMLILIVTGVVAPPALAHIAVKRRFSALFDLKGWGSILRANFSGFVVVLLIFVTFYTLMMLAWQILYFTVILCFLGPLLIMPVSFYMGLIFYRLTGQAYGDGLARAGQPVPLQEVDPNSLQPVS